MKKQYLYYILFVLILCSGVCVWGQSEKTAIISPDYSDIVLPFNISPINFKVIEKGSDYKVEISSQQGAAIVIDSQNSNIQIPLKKWRTLLEANKGQDIKIDIRVKDNNNSWTKLPTITNKISNEKIDSYVVYRRLHPTHYLINGVVGIYQRNLENFKEKAILQNKHYDKDGCLNCHTFCNNGTENMFLSIRSEKYGKSVLMVNDGKAKKIDAKFGYSSWHPSGKIVAYSINNLPIFFYTAREEVRDTVDVDSMIAYYSVDKKTVKTVPQLSEKDYLETYPTWSADGKYMYFCRAKMLWTDKKQLPPDNYNRIKYSIVRISYDIENDKWGEIETVVPAVSKSMLLPRISADGRWLLFCMCDFGCFPAWAPSSDFYMIDLQAEQNNGKYEYKKLDINSDQSEAWHSWSSNSRWIVFSSKRDYGTLTRLYISYIDQNGKAYKPFILPQKDPDLYNHFLQAYNLPEFISEPVPLFKEQLAKVVRGKNAAKVNMVDMPITMATGKADPASSPYGSQE